MGFWMNQKHHFVSAADDSIGAGFRLSELLGPLETMWERWTPAQDRFMVFHVDHFIKTMKHQVDELQEIRDSADDQSRMAYANEFVDCISVALNGLRWCTGSDPEKVVKAIDARNDRYVDPHQIIDTYIKNGWG